MRGLLQVSPTKGNVGFTSAQYGWSFTLHSFARLYCGRARRRPGLAGEQQQTLLALARACR